MDQPLYKEGLQTCDRVPFVAEASQWASGWPISETLQDPNVALGLL